MSKDTNPIYPSSEFTGSGNTIAPQIQTGGTNFPSALGIIVNNGPYGTEGNFNSPNTQYWVQLVTNSIQSGINSAAGNELNLTTAGTTWDNDGNQITTIVPAYYLPDEVSGNRTLPIGQPVEMIAMSIDNAADANANPLVRWFILGGTTAVQQVKVFGIPAMIGTQVPPYVIARPITATGIGGPSSNMSVGIMQAHALNDTFMCQTVPPIINAADLVLYDNFNKAVGVMEIGTYGTAFTTACRHNGGANGSANVLCTLTYDLYDPLNNTVLALNLTRKKPQAFGYAVTPASGVDACLAKLDNFGNWVLIEPYETTGSLACATP